MSLIVDFFNTRPPASQFRRSKLNRANFRWQFARRVLKFNWAAVSDVLHDVVANATFLRQYITHAFSALKW